MRGAGRPSLAARLSEPIFCGHAKRMVEPQYSPNLATQPLAEPAEPQRWCREYTILVLVGLCVSILAFLFFFLDLDLSKLRQFGYLGIFLISLIGSAAVVLPLPGAAVVVGSGQVVDDVLGIPFFLIVGVVAALGETIGELTGYAAGVGGRVMLENRPAYRWLDGWMRRNGVGTLFVLSVIPNPIFDVAGFMAGAVRMPFWTFFVSVFTGKTIKSIVLALGGEIGLEAIFEALG